MLPEARGQGIATELMKARECISKAVGVQLTSDGFTSLGAQKAAANAGYEENFSIR